jgi:hypothetical protein
MITKFYYWLWHDVMHLREPISWLVVHSMRDHLFTWQLAGGGVAVILWVLMCHFVAML